MLVQHLQPITRKPLRRSLPRAGADPAYLSAKLREVALRTYHAVRTTGDARLGNSPAGPELVSYPAARYDWTDLHREIVQLERDLAAQRLDLLASYVAALRETVETSLA